MRGHLIMSEKERIRKAILEKVKEKYITLHEASIQMRVSYRQAKRIWKRYCTDGDTGLIHRNRGNTAVGHGFTSAFKTTVIRTYQEKFEGFGPTLASEKLVKQGMDLNRETLRKWLIESGEWKRHRKRKAHRQHRERRARFGELLQIDGSIHDWFGVEYGKKCLLNVVDDATTTTLSLIAEGETTEIIFKVLKIWIEKYGIPQAIYVDRKSVYLGLEGQSMFEQACRQLGIEVIPAYSAQAKGRVERNHAVYQDRFVKELKLLDIKTIEGANQLLLNGFIDELNEKFAKEPSSHENAHAPIYDIDLTQILVWRYQRQLQNDWTIMFSGNYYQIKDKAKKLSAKQKVEIKIHLDGKMTVGYKGDTFKYEGIKKAKKPNQKPLINIKQSSREATYKGKAANPWRQFNPNWLSKKSAKNQNSISKLKQI